jgi:hypothetical protein
MGTAAWPFRGSLMNEKIHENAVAFMRKDLPNKMTAPVAPIAEPAFPLRSGHTADLS